MQAAPCATCRVVAPRWRQHLHCQAHKVVGTGNLRPVVLIGDNAVDAMLSCISLNVAPDTPQHVLDASTPAQSAFAAG